MMFIGQVNEGFWLSLTVTVKLQLGVPPVCEQVTVVVPTLKLEPEGGVQVTVPQVPPTVGEKLTTALHCPASATVMMLFGQVKVQAGNCKYTTNGS